MTQWGLDVLFNPAKRHMDEEKRRLQSTREEVGDNSGGRRIDLESGKVTIPKADDTDETPDTDGTAETGESAKDPKGRRKALTKDAKAEGKKDAPAKELTPAQERALKRRGREAR